MRAWILLFVVLVASFQDVVLGGGSMGILFVRFENPDGEGDNGQCCDGKWGLCQGNGCDHMFTICVDTAESGDSVSNCAYANLQSSVINDEDNIDFGDDIGGLENPILVRFEDSVPTEFALKVDVYDQDSGISGDDDHVDFLKDSLPIVAGDEPVEYTIGTRTSLTIEVLFECDADFYGPTCDVHCPTPSGDQHYTCSPTGEKVCDEGWEGPDCSEETRRPCDDSPCENGGSCREENGEAVCDCMSGTSGPRCELKFCDETCLPGTCEYVPDNAHEPFTCNCPDGYENIDLTCRLITTIPQTTTPTAGGKVTDCKALLSSGTTEDGVYEIETTSGTFSVYCDMSGGGWTVIQRRDLDGDRANWDRDWEDYKQGFGEAGLHSEFWVGLENIYMLTGQNEYKMKITFQTEDRDEFYAEYDSFSIEDEADNYRLHLTDYSGTAGDAMITGEYGTDYIANGMAFTTRDVDNDLYDGGNCATLWPCGWWHNNCFTSAITYQEVPYWRPLSGSGKNIRKAAMMLMPHGMRK